MRSVFDRCLKEIENCNFNLSVTHQWDVYGYATHFAVQCICIANSCVN